MKIKEVATHCGISPKSIRYYEGMGLLDIERGNNGYREFSEEQVRRIKEICLFRSFDISVEDIHQFYEEGMDLDIFLGIQMEKQQEKIFVLQENMQYMLRLQQLGQKLELHKMYEERCQKKGFRNDQQELEKQYYSKTKRGKQGFMILLVWGIAFAFLFDLGMAMDSFATFGWIVLGVIMLASVLSILLWFCFPAHAYLIKGVALLSVWEDIPLRLEERLKGILPWRWLRKLVSFLLLMIVLFGTLALVCWGLSILF